MSYSQHFVIWLFIFLVESDVFEELVPGNRLEILSNGTLIFNSITSEDKGSYLCEASNGIGNTLKSPFKIGVSGKLGNINFHIQNVYAQYM